MQSTIPLPMYKGEGLNKTSIQKTNKPTILLSEERGADTRAKIHTDQYSYVGQHTDAQDCSAPKPDTVI